MSILINTKAACSMPIEPKAFYRPNVFVFSGTKKEHAQEEFVREHVLCHVLAGELRFTEADKETVAKPGDTLLFRRNLLMKCEKRPTQEGQPFVVVYFVLEKQFLQRYALQHELKGSILPTPHAPVRWLKPGPALAGMLLSLHPYIDAGVPLSRTMIQHKLEEAILALSEQDAALVDWLFDADSPEKADLEDFMLRNYMFNVPMTKFAELTGRSLSTFQRDFQRLFGMNATRWLLKRRLAAAYEAITREHKMPVDLYLDLGFEDLSHFSRSFKQEFGVNASQLQK